MRKARVCAWLLLTLYSHLAFAENNYKFYEEPNWVKLKQPDIKQPVPVDRVKDGTHYLLVDSQTQVTKAGKVTYFKHYAEHIVNQNGVENSSQLNIDFNPEYQKLLVHKLNVWRNGKKIDKSSSARITLIQPERESKEHIYNGEHSLNIILEDIRVGDTVEYSYSRQGRNPVFGTGFGVEQSLQWSVPVGEVYRRIVWHKKKPLFYKKVNTDIKVEQVNKNGVTEYIISTSDVPAISLDNGAPKWFDPYAKVYFSDTQSWQDVVKWGRELFRQPSNASSNISDIANKITSKHTSKQQQISAALQYVQSNIRYLSLSLGESSHRPATPDVTLKRRFGDCKDKSTLYIALLQKMNITSYPALVNTKQKREIKKRLPAYSAFDHVLVQVIFNDKKYWFDPTRQYQFGSIEDIYQPDYGYALVLKQGSSSLENMHQPVKPHSMVVNESYSVDIKQRDNVKYKINTSYYGLDAEYQLDNVASKGKQKTQNNYLNFYKNYYPGLTVDEGIVISDVYDNGSLSISEKYSISDFWSHDKKKNEFSATFYTSSISSYLQKPKTIDRAHPYLLSHPVTIKQNVSVSFSHDDWALEKVNFIEDNDFFQFRYNASYDKEKLKLQLNYIYKSKIDNIPAVRYKEYRDALDRAEKQINYGIIYTKNDTTSNVQDSKNWFTENIWLIVVLSYSLLITVSIILWVLAEKRRPSSEDTLYYPVSVQKFIFMWISTLGVYSVYWFFKNYNFIKQRDGSSIMPIARGIFSVFWYYPIYKNLSLHQIDSQSKATIPPRYIGGLLAILYFFANVLANMEYYVVVFTVISGLLLLPMVNYVYHINDKNSLASRYNSRFSFRHLVLTIMALPMLFLLISSDIGLTPSDKVIAGEKLYAHDLKYMQRKGVIKPDDKIAYFYSDALFSIRDDGNGFTDRHVFSYWKEDGQLHVKTAHFSEIKDVNITWAKSFTENTVIKIIRKDGTEFLLFVSREKRKDKTFGRELKRRWKEFAKE